MAEGKKGFILYCDYKLIFDQLTDAEAGALIKHIFAYVNDEAPEMKDRLLNIAFQPIKSQLKRDLKDWENKREKRSEAGKKGMENRWHPITNDNNVINPITNITVNDTVNATVKDTVTVNDTVNVSGKGKKFTPPTKEDVFNEMILKIGDFTAHGESEKFLDFYESKGWFIGKNKMKDWKSAVRNWIRGMQKFNQNGSTSNQTKLGTSAARIEAARNF